RHVLLRHAPLRQGAGARLRQGRFYSTRRGRTAPGSEPANTSTPSSPTTPRRSVVIITVVDWLPSSCTYQSMPVSVRLMPTIGVKRPAVHSIGCVTPL